jgi:hypothetical protein
MKLLAQIYPCPGENMNQPALLAENLAESYSLSSTTVSNRSKTCTTQKQHSNAQGFLG